MTLISIYDDTTGRHVASFMVIEKPRRRWVDPLGLLVGLMLAPLVFGRLVF